MFGNRPYCTVGDAESEGDTTMFSVTFGRVRTLSFGDKIQSAPIKAGGSSWIVVYFPKVCCTAVPRRVDWKSEIPRTTILKTGDGPENPVGGAEQEPFQAGRKLLTALQPLTRCCDLPAETGSHWVRDGSPLAMAGVF
jgi:hypothetical protein